MPQARSTRASSILDIDEKSLNAEGRWPWSRNKLALMVQQLFEHYKVQRGRLRRRVRRARHQLGPREPRGARQGRAARTTPSTRPSSQQRAPDARLRPLFADEIGKYPVVLGFFLGGKTDKAGVLPPPDLRARSRSATPSWEFMHNLATGYSGNIEQLQKQATAAGHLYPSLDFDGVTRRVPIFMKYGDGYYEAMSFAMTRTYLGNVPAKIQVRPPSGAATSRPSRGWRSATSRIPLDERMSALVPYRGADRRLPLRLGHRRDPRHAARRTSCATRSSSSAPRPRACSTCAPPRCARTSPASRCTPT